MIWDNNKKNTLSDHCQSWQYCIVEICKSCSWRSCSSCKRHRYSVFVVERPLFFLYKKRPEADSPNSPKTFLAPAIMVLTSRLSVVWQLMTWQACASHWYQSLMMVLSTALSREKGRRGQTMPQVTKSSTFRWDLNDIVWCKRASVGSIVTFPSCWPGSLGQLSAVGFDPL